MNESTVEDKEVLNKTMGINTSLEYDFEKDPNPNINDISASDKIITAKYDDIEASQLANVTIDENHEDVKEKQLKKQREKEQKEETISLLGEQLKQKESSLLNLKQINKELENKLNKVNSQYEEIVNQLKNKPIAEDETSLLLKINKVEKDIISANSEIEFYKKQIEAMKDKIEFKSNIENISNLENLIKIEQIKNKELKHEYDILLKTNIHQQRQITNLDNESKFRERIIQLKCEIKDTKDNIKSQIDHFTKQERLLKLIHEKTAMINDVSKKNNDYLPNNKKNFTKEELNSVISNVEQLKKEVISNRNVLQITTKQNDDKILGIVNERKLIMEDYKEQEKINKALIFKRNELKRLIKLASDKIENNKTIFNQVEISNIKNNDAEVNVESNLLEVNFTNENQKYNELVDNNMINEISNLMQSNIIENEVVNQSKNENEDEQHNESEHDHEQNNEQDN